MHHHHQRRHHSGPPPARPGGDDRYHRRGQQPSDDKSQHGRRRRRARSQDGGESRPSSSSSDPWWQHPLVRACAATAITTGLSAALDSRGDPGQWKGAKGAKVVVATLGAALVDGFLANKHPDGVRHKVLKKGVEVAMDEAERKKQHDDKVAAASSSRSRGRTRKR